jgi:exonuclease III
VATWLPAARVDYVFADPSMAERLEGCEVVGLNGTGGADVDGASDHLPVVADFRLQVASASTA